MFAHGSGSSDQDGTIVSYEWDLDDDGNFDEATGKIVQRMWTGVYSGNISLRVTDNVGATAIYTTTATIVAERTSFEEPMPDIVGVTVHINCRASNPDLTGPASSYKAVQLIQPTRGSPIFYAQSGGGIGYISLTSQWWDYAYTWSTNPITNQGWTEEEMNGLGIGVWLWASWVTPEPWIYSYCTQVYADVQYADGSHRILRPVEDYYEYSPPQPPWWTLLGAPDGDASYVQYSTSGLGLPQSGGEFVCGVGPDLKITDIEPVQVVYETDTDKNDINNDGKTDLVQGKATVIFVCIEGFEELSDDKIMEVNLTFEDETYSSSVTTGELKQEQGRMPIYINAPQSTGDQEIAAEVDPDNIIEENNENNNTMSETVSVKSTRGLHLIYFPVERDNYEPLELSDYELSVTKSGEFIQATYPLSDSGLKNVGWPQALWGNAAGPGWFGIGLDCSEIAKRAKRLGADKGIGIVPWNYFDYHGSTAVGMACWFFGIIDGVVVETGYWTATAHEIGHTYDLPPGGGEEYKTQDGRVIYDGDTANGFWVAKKQPMENKRCFMGVGIWESLDYRWVCNRCYNYLFKEFREDKSDPAILVVDGVIYKDGSIELGRWYKVPEGMDDLGELTPGDYSLQILDGNGNILQEISFAAAFWASVDPLGIVETDFAPFTFAIPYLENSASVKVLHEGAEVAEVNLSTKLLNDAMESLPNDYDVLIKTVDEASIEQEVKNSLLSKLNDAKTEAEEGISYIKEGQDMLGKSMLDSASNIMIAFINEVNAEAGKKISEEDASEFINWAQKMPLTLQDQIVAGVPNLPPVAVTNGPYTGVTGVPVTLDGSGSSDPDGTIVSYEWDLDNDGVFDDATGEVINYTWTEGYSGNISLRVTDDRGATAIDTTTATIVSNQPPELAPIGDKTVDEGQLLSFTVSATDPEGDPLTYSASNLPSGATFDPTTGIFSWTPDYEQSGTYTNVHFEVTDGSAPVFEEGNDTPAAVFDVNGVSFIISSGQTHMLPDQTIFGLTSLISNYSAFYLQSSYENKSSSLTAPFPNSTTIDLTVANILSLGVWNYTYFTTGCANYNSASDQKLLYVVPQTKNPCQDLSFCLADAFNTSGNQTIVACAGTSNPASWFNFWYNDTGPLNDTNGGIVSERYYVYDSSETDGVYNNENLSKDSGTPCVKFVLNESFTNQMIRINATIFNSTNYATAGQNESMSHNELFFHRNQRRSRKRFAKHCLYGF